MAKNKQTEKTMKWWQDARFGMFIHWGPYTASHHDCWKMYDQGTTVQEYMERFEPKFTGENFDARKMVAFAKRVGFKYVVMTTRHHDGYCLWDTDTTGFSSTKLTPKRDFIAEFVQAARDEGLGVGLYYSLLDWRFQSYWDGPKNNPASWRTFLDFVHTQVRELMSRYGKIDMLWYDGQWGENEKTWGFKVNDEKLAEIWESKKLNAMVRKHQPGILINKRSLLPEDFGTPEKDIVPEARPWELCDTMGFYWGGSRYDKEQKTARNIITRLAYCVARSGNMLLNIGPKEDGSMMAWQQRTLEQVGEWLQKHGDCIYGCSGEWQRPFNMGLAPWSSTRKGNTINMIMLRYPGRQFELSATNDYRVVSAHLADTGEKLQVTHEPTRDVISGLPARSPDPIASVVKLKIKPKTPKQLAARREIGVADPEAALAEVLAQR